MYFIYPKLGNYPVAALKTNYTQWQWRQETFKWNLRQQTNESGKKRQRSFLWRRCACKSLSTVSSDRTGFTSLWNGMNPPLAITADTFRSCCNLFQAANLKDSFPWFSLSLGGKPSSLLGAKGWQSPLPVQKGCKTDSSLQLKRWNKPAGSPCRWRGWRWRWRWVRAAVHWISTPKGRGGNRTQLPKITISCFSVQSTTRSWVSQFPWEASSKSSLKPLFFCTVMPRYLYGMCACIHIFSKCQIWIYFCVIFLFSICIPYRPLISLHTIVQPFSSSSSTIATSKKWGEPLEKWK